MDLSATLLMINNSSGSYNTRRSAERVTNLNATNTSKVSSEIFCRINRENAYHSIQNNLSSCLFYEKPKYKI
jgi:hypothetical protein